jgi:hypothetical protein
VDSTGVRSRNLKKMLKLIAKAFCEFFSSKKIKLKMFNVKSLGNAFAMNFSFFKKKFRFPTSVESTDGLQRKKWSRTPVESSELTPTLMDTGEYRLLKLNLKKNKEKVFSKGLKM